MKVEQIFGEKDTNAIVISPNRQHVVMWFAKGNSDNENSQVEAVLSRIVGGAPDAMHPLMGSMSTEELLNTEDFTLQSVIITSISINPKAFRGRNMRVFVQLLESAS